MKTALLAAAFSFAVPVAGWASTLVPFDIEITFDYRISSYAYYDEATYSRVRSGPVGSRGAGFFRATGVFRTDDFMRFGADDVSSVECSPCFGGNSADSVSLYLTADRLQFGEYARFGDFSSSLTLNIDDSGEYVWVDDGDPFLVAIYKFRNIQVSGVPGWEDGRVGPAPVPLPAALPALAGGLALLGLVGARRRERFPG